VLLISFVEGKPIIFPELNGLRAFFHYPHHRSCIKQLISLGYIEKVRGKKYKLTLKGVNLCQEFMNEFKRGLQKYNIEI
jgi:hypothetical protein